MTLVELCCGTAALSLWALARRRPLTGFMGSKRRDAENLCDLLGARDPDRVLLVDAGPWGDVWTTLRDDDLRAQTVECLLALDAEGDLVEVWRALVLEPPPTDPAERVAQYLCLQSRAAGCIPIWWSPERARWESPSGSRVAGSIESAHQRGAGAKPYAGPAWPAGAGVCNAATRGAGVCDASSRSKQPSARKIGKLYRSHPSRGLVRIRTLAERVQSLDVIDWSRVEVVHVDVDDVEPIEDSIVYCDPPYLGAPRYAALLSRDRVLAIGERHAAVARIVGISEAEPLPLAGWTCTPLRATGKPEWVTMSAPPVQRLARQMVLDLDARC